MFQSSVLWLVLQVGLFGLFPGCLLQSPPADYLRFKELPVEKQHCEFKKLSIDKQIDYYLLDRNREPPDLSFADDIAGQGRVVIPALLKRLREEKAEYRQQALILIFEDMNRYADLRAEREVIDTLKETIAKMEDRDWAKSAQKSLNAIERGPVKGLKTPTPLPGCD